MQDKPTLCWRCAKACGECSWSDGSFTPVDGWAAIPTKIRTESEPIDSFLIEKCPLFEDDTARYMKKARPVQSTFGKVEYKFVKNRFAPRVPHDSLRWKLSQMTDLQDRINRLTGDTKMVCDLIFNYNNTYDDAATALYMTHDAIRNIFYKACKQLEAMA